MDHIHTTLRLLLLLSLLLCLLHLILFPGITCKYIGDRYDRMRKHSQPDVIGIQHALDSGEFASFLGLSLQTKTSGIVLKLEGMAYHNYEESATDENGCMQGR